MKTQKLIFIPHKKNSCPNLTHVVSTFFFKTYFTWFIKAASTFGGRYKYFQMWTCSHILEGNSCIIGDKNYQ